METFSPDQYGKIISKHLSDMIALNITVAELEKYSAKNGISKAELIELIGRKTPLTKENEKALLDCLFKPKETILQRFKKLWI